MKNFMKANIFYLTIFLLFFFFQGNAQICPVSSGTELITNGNFEAGNTGFTSQFTYNATTVGPGSYGIAKNPSLLNSFFQNIPDKTTGTGNMMVVDANTSAVFAYQTTVTVQPNTTYFFSAWIANINSTFENPSELEFFIKGAQVGTTLIAPKNNANWVQFYTSWFSGSTSGSITIGLKNANSISNGNDFALDNISFSTSCANIQGVSSFRPKSQLPQTISLCTNGGSAILDTKLGTTNLSFQWLNGTNYSTNKITGATGPSHSASTAGTYYVCIDTLNSGCPQADTVVVTDNFALSLGPDINLCDPATATLNTGIVNASYFNSITWTKNGTAIPSANGQTSLVVSSPGKYRVTVDGPGNCDGTDEVTVTSSLTATPVDGTYCNANGGTGTATLSVTGTGQYKWFSAAVGGTVVGKGSTITTPPLSSPGPHYFYVEDTSLFKTTIGPPQTGHPFTTINARGEGNETRIVFNALTSFTIDFIYVYAFPHSCPGVIGGFQVVSSAGTTIGTSANYSMPTCTQSTYQWVKVPVNITVPAGNGYSLRYIKPTGANTDMAWYENGMTYPTTYGTYVTFASVDPGISGWRPNSIPGMWRWDISAGTQCARIAVKATEQCPPCVPPSTLTISPSTTTNLCVGANQTLTANFTLGTPTNGNYYITWFKDGVALAPAATIASSATSATRNLSSVTTAMSGVYKVRIEDGNTATASCYKEASVSIVVNPLPTVSAGADKAVCSGLSTSITASGASTYSWNNGLGSGATKTVSPAATTTYTVTGTDSKGCVNTDDVVITVNPLPTVSAGVDKAICNGSSTTITATGASSYVWSPTTGLSSSTVASPTANPTSTTTYTVTGTDSKGCVNTDAMVLTVHPRPTVSAGADKAICSGASTTITATGATSYTWSPTTGLSSSSVASPTANPTTTTTYTVTGTDGNGCTNTDAMVLTVNPLPTVSAGVDKAVCTGSSTSITATGASSYVWSPSSGLSGTTTATVTANPTATTTYTVTGTDANGCVNTDAMVLTVNALPTVSAGVDKAICPGSGTTITATGASSYVWSPVAGLSSSTVASPTANPTATTTYTVTGTDANGCVNTDAMVLTVNSLPTVNAGADKTICNGGSTTLTATGATSYTWIPAATLTPANAATVTASPTSTTTYTVTGIDANGCEDTDDVIITVNPLPTATISLADPEICIGENADILFTLTGTAPFTITYTDPAGAAQTATANTTTHTIQTNVDGTYTLTGITDANACTNTATGTVTVNTVPALVVGAPTATCDYNTQEFTVVFNVSGGKPAYTITGETSGTFASGIYTSNPVAGGGATNYSYSVSDASGCPDNTNVLVTGTQNCSCPVVGSLTTPATAICADQTSVDLTVNLRGALTPPYNIIITAPDGTTLPFNNLVAGDNIVTITNLQSGNYRLTKAGDMDCDGSASGSTPLTINPLPTATIALADPEICIGEDASIDFTLTGTGPFTITYTDPTGATQTETANTTTHSILTSVDGAYTLVGIEDANGCTNTATGAVTVNTVPALVVGAPTATCNYTTQEFVVEFAISGGKPAYTVTGETGGAFASGTYTSNPVAGGGSTNFTYSVSDASGCPDNTNVPVTGNQNCSCPVVGTLTSSTHTICADETSVDFSVNLSGAIAPPYHIDITAPDGTVIPFTGLIDGANTITITDLQTGIYTLTRAGDTDCYGSASGTAEITINALPTAAISGGGTICNDGTAQATINFVLTGTAPFTINYTDAAGAAQTTTASSTTHSITTSTDGSYALTGITDNNTCTNTATGTVSVDYFDDPVPGTPVLTCDPNNSPTNGYKYIIEVPLTGGDQGSYDELRGVAGAFSATGVWTSDPIDELITTDLEFTDINGCNPVVVPGLNLVCSCPESATIAVDGGAEICELGSPTTTGLTVTLDPGINTVSDWAFKVVDANGATVGTHDYTTTRYNGPNPLVISGVGVGTYKVENLNGTCDGSELGTAVITYFPSPVATISGTETICDDPAITTDVTVAVTNGTAPFSVIYAIDGTSQSPALTGGASITYPTNDFGTHTLVSVTDANGCEAKPGDMDGDAVITPKYAPAIPVLTTSPTGVLCTGTGNHAYSIDVVPTADEYIWSVSSGTGIDIQGSGTGATLTDILVDLTLSATDGVIQVKAKNECGEGPVLDINVDVTPTIAPTVTISADKTTICADSSATFTTSGINAETTSPVFAWFITRNGSDQAVGSGLQIETLTGLEDGDSVFVRMTSDYVCSTPQTIASNKVKMTVNPMLPVSVGISADQNFGV